MIIALFSFIFAYISPALYFFVLYATIYQLNFPGAPWVAKVVAMLFVVTFIVAIAGSLRGKKWAKNSYIVSIIFAIFNVIILFTVFYNSIVIYLKLTGNPLSE